MGNGTFLIADCSARSSLALWSAKGGAGFPFGRLIGTGHGNSSFKADIMGRIESETGLEASDPVSILLRVAWQRQLGFHVNNISVTLQNRNGQK